MLLCHTKKRMESTPAPLPVPDFPPRLLVDVQGGYCNLKCPKCWVHGPDDNESLRALRGRMSLEDARKILDEVMAAKPAFQPNMWTEPLLAKNFKEHMRAVKERGIPASFNTNGLLLDDEMAAFLVEIKLDSIFISIDATKKETLMKTRGTDKLDEIEKAVFTMLKARGEGTIPRVGVSFTEEAANFAEREEFIAKWLPHVDVIRIGERYEDEGRVKRVPLPEHRTPCGALYDTMAVQFNGNVSLCCLDGFHQTNVGNVIKDGVHAVWHGEELTKVRHYHETGQWDKVPFCKNCNVWAKYDYEETIRDGVLIRSSPLMTYYNRVDKLDTWKEENRAGHVTKLIDAAKSEMREQRTAAGV